jgi:hypothetical protein
MHWAIWLYMAIGLAFGLFILGASTKPMLGMNWQTRIFAVILYGPLFMVIWLPYTVIMLGKIFAEKTDLFDEAEDEVRGGR